MALNRKQFTFVGIAVLIGVITAILWFFVLSKKEVPDTEGEIIAPEEEVEKIDEFSEFPEDMRPLLKDSLDEALLDIEALGL